MGGEEVDGAFLELDLTEGTGVIDRAIDVYFTSGDEVEDRGTGNLGIVTEDELEVAELDGVGIGCFWGGGGEG